MDLSGNIYSWGGGSSAVASVSGTGWATAVGPGSITMWGFLRAPGTTYKCPYQIKQPTSTPVRVGPTITSISPQTGEQGTAVPVVISGSGFGTSPTVTTTAGSVSGVTSNGSTINATFTISSGKATGNYTVVVTNTNQATTSFFVTAQCSPTVSTTDQLRSCDGHTVYQGILTIGGANEANVTDTLVSASSDNTITVETQGSPYKYSTFCPPGSICYDEDYIGFHNNMYPSAHINWNVQIFCSNSPYPSQTITRSETVTCQ